MARIVITSDLHLGITSAAMLRTLVNAIEALEPTLTVLAGDLGEGLPHIVECLKLFAHLPGEVAVLAGNHDVWARDNYSSQDLWERCLPEAVQAAGMLWLEGTVWQRDGLAVAGSLAWYDYSAADPAFLSSSPLFFAERKGYYNLDARYVDWPWSDPEFAVRLGDGLCERLQRLEADPRVRSVLVVSHVPLFEEQMCRKPHDPHWGLSNAYFGNLTLGQQVLKMSKVRAVVSGHTHVGLEGQVRRSGFPEEQAIAVSVLGSDYHAPVYSVIDSTTLVGMGKERSVPVKDDIYCQRCGANWSKGQFSEGCQQCGGGALERTCPVCNGRCGTKWLRAVMDSWDFDEAHWIGSCGYVCTCGYHDDRSEARFCPHCGKRTMKSLYLDDHLNSGQR